jgi:hypothetical protein
MLSRLSERPPRLKRRNVNRDAPSSRMRLSVSSGLGAVDVLARPQRRRTKSPPRSGHRASQRRATCASHTDGRALRPEQTRVVQSCLSRRPISSRLGRPPRRGRTSQSWIEPPSDCGTLAGPSFPGGSKLACHAGLRVTSCARADAGSQGIDRTSEGTVIQADGWFSVPCPSRRGSARCLGA